MAPAGKGTARVGTPATVALTRARITFEVLAYEHDPTAASYGMEAAEALGLDPRTVFKTLVAEVDGSPAVAVVPVSAKLDFKAFAAALGGKKAMLADQSVAERVTGYVVGGISPLGQKRRLPTVVDASAWEHARVYVSAGRRGVDLGIAPADLVQATGASTASVSRW